MKLVYQPTTESLQQHPLPDWFAGAKFGIFVHWGLYSIPAWAEIPQEWIEKVKALGWVPAQMSLDQYYALAHNVYSEWYLNTLRFEDSPVRQYHEKTYGAGFEYHQFAPLFNSAIQNWDPDQWSTLFKKAGARYVILTTKHHDGFLLWPSKIPCPRRKNYQTERDLVSELTDSVRRAGMKMGLYYSGGLDWSFSAERIDSYERIFTTVVQGPEFVSYVDCHWRELIEKYRPSILWNDIGYPIRADVLNLFADYYNQVPDGVINDRFRQAGPDGGPIVLHADYLTPEYYSFDKISAHKWETCRGMGYSFAYNQCDNNQTYLSSAELIRMLVDIVSKNGNLLLSIGPKADGTIPAEQHQRLIEIGQWLEVNSEAIYDTEPWSKAEGITGEGIPLRFTWRDGFLYTILLDQLQGQTITLLDIPTQGVDSVSIIGDSQIVRWDSESASLTIHLQRALPEAPAWAIRISQVKK